VRAGDDVLIISWRDRTWWKNLRGGAPVTVHLTGKDWKGTGCAVEDESAVAQQLLVMLKCAPRHQTHFSISLAPDGRPSDPEALEQLARSSVIVRITDLTAV
jgi:hypothetical protein